MSTNFDNKMRKRLLLGVRYFILKSIIRIRAAHCYCKVNRVQLMLLFERLPGWHPIIIVIKFCLIALKNVYCNDILKFY
jgi:hypothetical protein